jgi:hypothetical protein
VTQIVYIALHPRVKIERDPEADYGQVVRDDKGEPVIERYEPKHTRRLYEEEHVARREANAYAGRRNPSGFGRVIAIDIDDELHLDATDHEKWQHAERQLFRWTIEEQRLRPADRGEPVIKAETFEQMRAERDLNMAAAQSYRDRVREAVEGLDAAARAQFAALCRTSHGPCFCTMHVDGEVSR